MTIHAEDSVLRGGTAAHKEALCEVLPKGSTLYFRQTHRGAKGTSRWYVITIPRADITVNMQTSVLVSTDANGLPRLWIMNITWDIGQILKLRHHDDYGIQVRGSGIDGKDKIRQDLGTALYGDPEAFRAYTP